MRLLAATAVWLAALAQPAGATIMMVDASSIQGANVLFNEGAQSGATVFGFTQSGTQVLFTGADGGGGVIRADGGQARIEGALDTTTHDPNDTFLLDALAFRLANGATFNNLEFNLKGGDATSATFILVDGAGAAFSFANLRLGAGENSFGFQGQGGDTIRSVDIALNGGGIGDVRQIRLDQALAAIPEPTSWTTMILGFGAVGALIRRRRQHQPAAA
jgi:hypothetical protein